MSALGCKNPGKNSERVRRGGFQSRADTKTESVIRLHFVDEALFVSRGY